MKSISDFSVRLNPGDPPSSVELLRAGSSTSIKIAAINLLAQFETSQADVLLVLDEDCLYEEMLHFCLLRRGQLIDHLRYGAPYTSGIFKLIEAKPDQLLFNFASSDMVCLSIDHEGSRWPRGNAPGASYANGFLSKHYLSLKIQDTKSSST
jgi:hypothetical protein